MTPISTLVEDVAAALGYWMPWGALVDHVCERFPHVKRRSVERIIWRLVRAGSLEVRRVVASCGRGGAMRIVATTEVRAVREMWEVS